VQSGPLPKTLQKANRFCGNRSHRGAPSSNMLSPLVFLRPLQHGRPSPRSPPLRSGAGGFPCCEDQENYRADANRFQKELPCVTGCQWTTDGFTEYLRQNREKSRFFPASTRQWPKLPHFLNHFRNNPNELKSNQASICLLLYQIRQASFLRLCIS